ncbi:MAG: DNA polymerase III subunit [Planctomycetes bacterium]|nr:DNA polymerase III subunit [Planctomycetota bacterium]
MSSAELLGHRELVEGLLRAARAGRLAHALLFHGPEGVGKFLAAHTLAAGLLCERGPAFACGSCGACRQLAAGSHADLFVIDAQTEGEDAILVERVRAGGDSAQGASLGDFLALRAREGGWRVVLLRDAHRMNASSQNALLKTLEEPGERVLLVLETSRIDRLLPTTISRCVRVAFGTLELEDVRTVLRRKGVDLAAAEPLARWAQGAPGRALSHARENAGRQLELAWSVLRGEIGRAQALEELLELPGEFHGETPAALLRSRARSFLDLALGLLLDAERAAAGVDPVQLAHGAGAAELARLPAASRERRLAELRSARQDVERNLAGEGLLERGLLALRGPRRDRSAQR